MMLTQKISLSIFVTAILTAGAIGFFVFTTAKSGLETAIGDNQLEVTRQTMDKIDRLLYERYLDISTIAANDSLESFFMKGESVVNENLAREFHENTILTGPWDLLYAVNTSGVVVVSTKKEEIGKFVSEYLQRNTVIEQALQRKVYYSDLVMADETGKPTILFAAPVRSRELGRPVVGVVIGNFSWAVVSEILEELVEKARLYNAEGFLIGSSDADENRNDLLRDDRLDPVVQSALKERETSGIFPSSKTSVSILASHTRQLGYLNYKGDGWRLVIETPTDIAFTPALREARDLALVSVILSILAALAIFIIINRNVIRPVALLTQTAGVIARGELTRRAQVSSKDEIGKLAENFNAMTDGLVEARKLPESIIHAIGDGLLVFDQRGKIELINPQVVKIFGIEERNIAGKEIATLTSLTLFGNLVRLLGTNPEAVFRKEFPMRDDMTVEITAVPVEFGQEQKRLMIILHDITREKHLERSKIEFVSIAAHQLRTPLTALKWSIHILDSGEAGALNSEQARMIKTAFSSIEKMVSLVSNLLDVARLEEGRYVYKPVKTSITNLIASVVKNLSEGGHHKGQRRLFFEAPKETLPDVLIDTEAIEMVLKNLLDNAMRYTSKGTTKIRAIQAQEQITVSVHDTGIGIPENQQERIFTKFFRGKNAIKIEPNGSGLGLFIANNIVKAHGGTIWFESKEGQGTTFHFTLPIAS